MEQHPSIHGKIRRLARDLAQAKRRAEEVVAQCLVGIADPAGQGHSTFLKVHDTSARAIARSIDKLRRINGPLPAFAGVPVSAKDLFDLAGDVTTAGARVLADKPPATSDCPAVARLRAAGFIIIGRTNMTEFAFSGLGINPHFGTPLNPWDRAAGRIPGGSSSGAAISVTDQMAVAGLATDTGGSCRIPAALTGLVGWKPTARRIPLEGVVPLSPTLDSVGCLAASVEDCVIMDAVLAGEPTPATVDEVAPQRVRIAVPDTLVLDGCDDTVARDFDRALAVISTAGIAVDKIALPELAEIAQINAKGGFPAADAYAWHRRLLETRGEQYDPRVRARILRGREQQAVDYLDLQRGRADLIARIRRRIGDLDALAMPTVPLVAPRLDELDKDEEFTRVNLLMLRNPSIANFLDLCAISLPIHLPGAPPVGLMLIADHGADRHLQRVAKTIETLIGTR